MKLLVVLGRKTGGVTPYTMAQVEDHAHEEELPRHFIEQDALEVLQRDHNGIPARLIWIEQEGFHPPGEDFLAALADGAKVPWEILEDRDVHGTADPGQMKDTTK